MARSFYSTYSIIRLILRLIPSNLFHETYSIRLISYEPVTELVVNKLSPFFSTFFVRFAVYDTVNEELHGMLSLWDRVNISVYRKHGDIPEEDINAG